MRREEILQYLTPVEVPDALRLLDLLETAGRMSREEADDWREAIVAWARFRLRMKIPQAMRTAGRHTPD